MDNKFFSFSAPYLSFIDQGHMFRKPFSWLYALIAILNLLLPLVIIYEIINRGFFETETKTAFTILIVWAVIAFAGWISFQLWWDRKTKITYSSDQNAEFVATPVFAHLIQTFGEWVGTWIGLVGFSFALLTTIFLGQEANYLIYEFSLPVVGEYLRSGAINIILMPLYGFLIIVLSRFVAEQIKALSAIANNTKQIKTD